MEYKYKAFISYRHLEPDMQAAEKLQKLLEAYKPPKSLGKTKENWRIFRDVSELQSSSDLSEDIRNAVETSEYLIVICSPKYKESKWCLQELNRFRELHGNTNENIITLLVSGLPQESFPEELTYTEVTTTDENGNEVKVRMDVEPLAANITADSLKESMKKLNTEYLRIAAPLLGCDFNDLFQREKRREAARRRRIFGGVTGILSLISVISIASAVTINGKNVRIQEQNDQIKEQNTQIIAQNEQIEKKNTDLLVENAGHLAVESENLFSENSLIPAIQKAVEALPAQEEKPVIPEAEYALSRELGMYRHQQLVPRLALKHECSVEQLSFMGGGVTVVSQDATGVYFWDAVTGGLLKKITASDEEFASEKNGSANELTAVFDVSPDKTGTYFDKAGDPGSTRYEDSSVFNVVHTNYVHDVDADEPGTGGDVFIYNSDSTVWRLDGATGSIRWKSVLPEDAYLCNDIIFGEKSILRLYQDKTVLPGGSEIQGKNHYLDIIDRETGAQTAKAVISDLSDTSFGILLDIDFYDYRDGILYTYNDEKNEAQAFEIKDNALVPAGSVPAVFAEERSIHNVYMQFIGDEPIVISNEVSAFDLTSTFTRCENGLKAEKWSLTLPVNYFNNGRLFHFPAAECRQEHDILVALTNRHISFIDYETGKELRTIALDADIIDSSYGRNGVVMITDAGGREYVLPVAAYVTGNATDNDAMRVQTIDTAVSLCSYSRGKYVTSGDYSNTAYIQYTEENPMFTAIDAGEYMYVNSIPAVTDDGSLAAVYASYYPDGKYSNDVKVTRHFFIYSTAGGELTEIKALEDYSINAAAFTESGKLIVNAKEPNGDGGISTQDMTYIVDPSDGSVKKVEGVPAVVRSDMKFIPEGDSVYFLADSERNLVRVSADGSFGVWEQKAEDAITPDRKIVDAKYAVSGDRAAVLAESANEEFQYLEIYSFADSSTVSIDCDFSGDLGLAVRRIFWQDSDTVGVFFSNNTVSFFDAATGKRTVEVSLSGMGQEPVSVAPVTADTFAVLCRDSCIYEMNEKGMTDRSCRLDFSSEDKNSIRSYDSTNAARLETKPSSDGTHIYVVWDSDQAWLLDTERFAVRYRIDDFAAAPAHGDKVFINDRVFGKAGVFPIYTTKQLISTAWEYLRALGEG